jgi:hypothetical protein
MKNDFKKNRKQPLNESGFQIAKSAPSKAVCAGTETNLAHRYFSSLHGFNA